MTNQKHNPLKHNPSPKVKSTPGPWSLLLAPTQVVSYSKIICNVNHKLSESCSKDNPSEAYANARLIAAAPELLEACHKSRSDFEDLLRVHGGILDQELALNIHGAIKALTQAIAKAAE